MVLVVEKRQECPPDTGRSFPYRGRSEHRDSGQIILSWARLVPNPLTGQQFRTPREETGSYDAANADLDNNG